MTGKAMDSVAPIREKKYLGTIRGGCCEAINNQYVLELPLCDLSTNSKVSSRT